MGIILLTQHREDNLKTFKELIDEAKDDGDTVEQFVSTLSSHLIYLVQTGNFKLEKEIAEYVIDARSLWDNDGEAE